MISRTGFTVPSALATCVTETILVRPDSKAAYCSKMISPRSLTGITRSVAPVCWASICQGTMLAWCSMVETMISSPGPICARP